MRLNRAGVTLVELLVATALTGLVATLALGTLARVQRGTQGIAERAQAQSTLRSGAQLLRAELRDLSAATNGDLLSIGPDRVVYRADRAFALACGPAPDGVLLRLDSFRALRLPAAGRDTLELLLPSATPGEMAWTRLGIIGPPRSDLCPDGSPALGIPTAPLPAVVPGRYAVRTWEVMEVRSYASGGDIWLGARSVSAGEGIQPVAGPLTAGGFRLGYLDAAGSPTGDPLAVRSIAVSLWSRGGMTSALGGASRSAALAVDSLSFRIQLAGGGTP